MSVQPDVGSHSLTKIFGGAKADVLDALVDAEWTTSSEIVHETGYDRDVLQIALNDLEDMGLIRTAKTMNGRSWRLNVESQLGEHIARIVQEGQA